jgi:hypothetical protein
MMKVVAGSDWSVGLNQTLTHASADALLLETMRRELRTRYDDLVREPLPAELAQLAERLDARKERSDPR